MCDLGRLGNKPMCASRKELEEYSQKRWAYLSLLGFIDTHVNWTNGSILEAYMKKMENYQFSASERMKRYFSTAYEYASWLYDMIV